MEKESREARKERLSKENDALTASLLPLMLILQAIALAVKLYLGGGIYLRYRQVYFYNYTCKNYKPQCIAVSFRIFCQQCPYQYSYGHKHAGPDGH